MLTKDSAGRKETPMARGLLDYFPDALAEVARVSLSGAAKHGTFDNEGNPNWDKSKSTDHADCIIRHLADRGEYDNDDMLHSAKVAWRALAMLQIELDNMKVKVSGLDSFSEFERMLKAQNEDRFGDVLTGLNPAQADSDTAAFVRGGKPPSDDTGVYFKKNQGEYGDVTVLGDPGLTIEDIAALLGIDPHRIVDERTHGPIKLGDNEFPKAKRAGTAYPQNKSMGDAPSASIPSDVYWCSVCKTFHGRGQMMLGAGFHTQWYARRGEFPIDILPPKNS